MSIHRAFVFFAAAAMGSVCAAAALSAAEAAEPAVRQEFVNRQVWPDTNGVHINAHGGCMLKVGDTYYWYGEHRPERDVPMKEKRFGVHVYSSKDLYNWKDEGLAFEITDGSIPKLQPEACNLERPKVVYNAKTKKYVMWFHAEIEKNYKYAYVGAAVSDKICGPFKLTYLGRTAPGTWPVNMPEDLKDYAAGKTKKYDGKYNRLVEDYKDGQQSRDMTVFVDDDAKAYIFCASENNATLHIVELNDEYTGFTGRWWRTLVDKSYEAPVVFRHDGKYYLLGSHCTGWAPNAGRAAVADSIGGPWRELGNFAVDQGGNRSYEGQTAHMFTAPDKNGKPVQVVMFDIWKPQIGLINSQYMWLPLEWKGEQPILHYRDKWSLAAPNAEATAGYLFAHFKGERSNEWEQIFFAISKDGAEWKPMNNGNSVLQSNLGEGGVRDPFVVRNPDTGVIYLIATDLCIGKNGDWGRAQSAGSRAIIVWESKDMVNWSEPRRVEVAVKNAGCTWAPEAFWDAKQKNFFVFWASRETLNGENKQRIYSARTKDFRSFTPAKLYVEKPNHIIDTDIVEDNGKLYRFSKDETHKSIILEVSDSLEGEWTPVPGFPVNNFVGFEGPECFRMADGRWCMIIDHYSRGQGYKAFFADDLAKGNFAPSDRGLSFPYKFRHGGVIPLSAKEYNALMKKWGPSESAK